MMELSKLNISSIAKEEIRRRFFDSRSQKKNTSSDSLDTSHKQPDEELDTTKKDLSEKEVEQVIDQREEETCAGEDDGFPLITSVFSLALPSSGAADECCVSTENIGISSDEVTSTAGTPQSIACTTTPSKEVSSCKQENLPFVVKCSPNGIITVCSPPNPSSSCKFREDRRDAATVITSSLKGSVCSTESSDMTTERADRQIFPDHTTNITNVPIPNMVTFIDATQPTVVPVEKPRSEFDSPLVTSKNERPNNDDVVCETPSPTSLINIQSSEEIKNLQSLQTINTNLSGSVKTSSERSSILSIAYDQTSLSESGEAEKEQNNEVIDSNTSHDTLNHDIATHELSIEEEYIDQSVPTRQEEKIRRLKDVLRQKEVELEKLRFKSTVGSSSAAAQLRANFLKKNPSLCRRSRRINTSKIVESNSQCCTTLSTNKNDKSNKCGKNEVTFKEKKTSFDTERYTSKDKVSDNADSNISNPCSVKNSTAFTDQEKYKLVNVTILQGQTRTLAVPLNHVNTAPKSFTTKVQNKPSLISVVTERATRKRKQQMPKKKESNICKRKLNNDVGASGGINSDQGRPTADASSTHCKLSPTGHTTRFSPRRGKGHQSLQRTPEKRKFSTTNELLPKKIAKIKSSLPVSSKAGEAFTKAKKIHSTESSTTATKQPSATLMTSARQVTTSGSKSGQKVAYVLHVNGAGAAANEKSYLQSSAVSSEDIVKRVVESMSKKVFALVSKVPGENTEHGRISDSGSSVIVNRYSNTSTLETTPNKCPNTTNISGSPASCEVPAPALKIPSIDVKHTKIPTGLGKVDISNQTVGNSTTSHQPTQHLPSSSYQNNEVVQSLQSNTTVSSHHLATPLVKNITTDQPTALYENSIISVTGTGNLLRPLTVSAIAPEVQSVPQYTVTVPFAIAGNFANNVRSLPTKNMANTNPTSRLIAPKPTSCPNTSRRLLAPKPATSRKIKVQATSKHSIKSQSTTSSPVAAKPASTKRKSAKNVLPSKNTGTKSVAPAPITQVVNILPKPVMTVPTSFSSTLPETLNNGNILVYDVVQSNNLAQVEQSTPLASKEAAKLVVYVSNTGDSRNLGIIKDKKIYLNSNQATTVTHQPKPKSPVTTSTSEFIPNPQDTDFKALLGLEHIVKLLAKD